jgi:hypothetical protein
MTIEFWPRSLLRGEKPKPRRKSKPRKPRRPRLPIGAGKAHQQLSMAIIMSDDDLACWVHWAFKSGQVHGQPRALIDLAKRFSEVLVPVE